MTADTFQQLFQTEPLLAIGYLLLAFVLYLAAALVPACALLFLVYLVLTIPMRRNERARLFLDLLELGLKEGHTPEATLAGVADANDPALGEQYHILRHLLQGNRLGAALDCLPRFLPPQIRAMLKAGERIGDIRKVLPACRQLLKDGVSHVRGAVNYVVLLAFVVTPFTILIPLVLRVKVLPTYQAVFAGMTAGSEKGGVAGGDADLPVGSSVSGGGDASAAGELPAFSRFVFGSSDAFSAIQLAMLLGLWLGLFAYIGGPWLHERIGSLLGRLPWRRMRLHRDFSAILAVLLDAEVPEAEAVRLAAESTANPLMVGRAAQACELLAAGRKLPESLRVLYGSGELRWRLANALQRRGGFLRALTGWHEALDARAFQLEQSAAQITTTALVLLNGLIVGSIVIAVFLLLIKLLNEAILW